MTGPWIVALGVIAALTVLNALLLLALARYVGTLATRLPQPLALELSQGPDLGTALDADAVPPTLAELLPQRGGADGRRDPDTLLVFLSTGCSSCLALVHDLNLFAKDYPELVIAPIVSGDGEAAERMRAALVRAPALLDGDRTVARAFAVDTVPFALLYRAGKLDAKAVVNSRDMLESLMAGRIRPHGDELLEAFTGAGPAAPVPGEDKSR
jgi:thiol-disulfide isomerase/thioredoxin